MLDEQSTGVNLRVLMTGEVFGSAGRKAIARIIPEFRKKHNISLVIANGESAAGGYGLTVATAMELLKNGVDVITSGSRIFDQREMASYLRENQNAPILRPLNYPQGVPGRASIVCDTPFGPVEVLNLNGRVYFNEMDSPFRVINSWLADRQRKEIPLIIDFHAEATSEKVVLGWYLDGRASAVLGTHTRTPTADARLLKNGTAHVSDVGLVGSFNSVAGLEAEAAIKPFTSHLLARSKSSRKVNGPLVLNSVLIEIEPGTTSAVSISRMDLTIEDAQ